MRRLIHAEMGVVIVAPVLTLLACACLSRAQRSPVDRAWDLIAQGQRPEAVRLLGEIIKVNPHNADARLLLGSLLMEEGQRSQSIAQLTEAVRLRPDSPKAQNALGEALNAFGEFKAARGPFARAVTLDPRFVTAQVNLGLVLIEAGQLRAAAPHLDLAIQLTGQSPDAAYPRYLRAKVYTAEGQIKKAAAELQQATSLRPNFAEAWSDLGEARKTLLDDSGALMAFEKAVHFAPTDPVAQTRLGEELLNQRKAREAVPHLEEAVRLNPEDQSALYSLQRALREDGLPEQAEAVRWKLTRLLRNRDRADQDSFTAIQLNDQGAALQRAGRLREALEKYRAAHELDPQHLGIRLNFAVALLQLGQWDQGVAELREILQLDPKNLAAKAALEGALAYRPRGKQ